MPWVYTGCRDQHPRVIDVVPVRQGLDAAQAAGAPRLYQPSEARPRTPFVHTPPASDSRGGGRQRPTRRAGRAVRSAMRVSIRTRISSATLLTSSGARTSSPPHSRKATTKGASMPDFVLSLDRTAARSHAETPAAIKSGTSRSISCIIASWPGRNAAYADLNASVERPLSPQIASARARRHIARHVNSISSSPVNEVPSLRSSSSHARSASVSPISVCLTPLWTSAQATCR